MGLLGSELESVTIGKPFRHNASTMTDRQTDRHVSTAIAASTIRRAAKIVTVTLIMYCQLTLSN